MSTVDASFWAKGNDNERILCMIDELSFYMILIEYKMKPKPIHDGIALVQNVGNQQFDDWFSILFKCSYDAAFYLRPKR